MKKSKKKALGQHFLVNPTILNKIVYVINPRQNDFIIEIGAGKGALTELLSQKKARVIAIEKDGSLIPYLKKLEFANLTVLETDALWVSFENLFQGKPGKIVGNLPYVISSPLLFKVLEEKRFVSSCVFLLQKEVAQRVCAQPGTKKYAPISILFHNDFHTRLHFLVSASSFSPPPRVESALVSLKKRHQQLFSISDQKRFAEFLKGAFRSRRKKLSNNLKNLNFPNSAIKKAFLMCGIEENLRPEQVSLSQFATLYEELSHLP